MKNLLNITHFSSSLLLLSSFSFGSVSVTISNSGNKTLFDAPVQLSSDSFLPIENHRITNQLYNYLFDSINNSSDGRYHKFPVRYDTDYCSCKYRLLI